MTKRERLHQEAACWLDLAAAHTATKGLGWHDDEPDTGPCGLECYLRDAETYWPVERMWDRLYTRPSGALDVVSSYGEVRSVVQACRDMAAACLAGA